MAPSQSQEPVGADAVQPEPAAAHQIPTEQLPANDELEADDDYDSAFGGSEDQSQTTSVSSATYRGYLENGRRYTSHSDTQYMHPVDDKQWESLEMGHILFLILDCQRLNPFFRSPLSDNAQNVLDLGTGQGDWAAGVADKHPNLTVYGVDLYPPPQTWVPPNCILEVDDISKPWTWNKKWDLIHLRVMMGTFDEAGWANLYRQAYDNLAPGGWIEHVENDIGIFCDDDSVPEDSLFTEERYRSMFLRCAKMAGRELDTTDHLIRRIEAAGFTNVQSQDYKMPIGTWPKHPIYKDAGRVNMVQMKTGLDGWLMWLMTNFGEPEPWSVEEVHVYAAKVRKELEMGYHIYNKSRRVWAQKPFEAKKVGQEVEVENLA